MPECWICQLYSGNRH